MKELSASSDEYVIFRDKRPIRDLKDMMRSSAELYKDNVAFMQRFSKDEDFRSITYGKAFEDLNGIGTALLGLRLGGSRIAVVGENCYQWALSYLAIAGGVGTVVPMDKELGAPELEQLCAEAQVSAVIYSGKYSDMFAQIKAGGRTAIKYLINMHSQQHTESEYSLRRLSMEGKEAIKAGERSYIDACPDRDGMGILLFTSGTTGISKGVMLSQSNICSDIMMTASYIAVSQEDVFFSVLPVHHTYECTCGMLVPLYSGAAVAYCEGLKHIPSNLREIQPSIMLGVPLIFESLYRNIWKKIRKQGKEQDVIQAMQRFKLMGPGGMELRRKALSEIYETFGSRMRLMISGGAAINPSILDFFNDLGYFAVQGYGLTECSPLAALNPENRALMRNASVGRFLPGMQVRIDSPGEDGIGEICLSGPNVMLGYYNMPEESARVLRDGWFYTGDLGYVDEEGYIYITGRAKNVIITANGKNVFPEELEHYLSAIPYVEESMVWAEKDADGNDTDIIASIYPDKDYFREVFGVEYDHDKAAEVLEEQVSLLNDRLPLFKQIHKVSVRDLPFEKTTASKIRRFDEKNRK